MLSVTGSCTTAVVADFKMLFHEVPTLPEHTLYPSLTTTDRVSIRHATMDDVG